MSYQEFVRDFLDLLTWSDFLFEIRHYGFDPVNGPIDDFLNRKWKLNERGLIAYSYDSTPNKRRKLVEAFRSLGAEDQRKALEIQLPSLHGH